MKPILRRSILWNFRGCIKKLRLKNPGLKIKSVKTTIWTPITIIIRRSNRQDRLVLDTSVTHRHQMAVLPRRFGFSPPEGLPLIDIISLLVCELIFVIPAPSIC